MTACSNFQQQFNFKNEQYKSKLVKKDSRFIDSFKNESIFTSSIEKLDDFYQSLCNFRGIKYLLNIY